MKFQKNGSILINNISIKNKIFVYFIQMVKSASGKMNMRSFEVVESSKHGGCKTKSKPGRYIKRTPYAAALNAFNRLCAKKRIKGQCTLIVGVRETTAGSKHKVFRYKMKRGKLSVPLIMMEGTNSEYVIEYKSSGKSLKGDGPGCKTPGQTRGRMKTKTRGKKARRLSGNNVRKLIKKSLRPRRSNRLAKKKKSSFSRFF